MSHRSSSAKRGDAVRGVSPEPRRVCKFCRQIWFSILSAKILLFPLQIVAELWTRLSRAAVAAHPWKCSRPGQGLGQPGIGEGDPADGGVGGQDGF